MSDAIRNTAYKSPFPWVGGYGLQADEDGFGRANKGKERLWYSPACVKPRREALLF
jgi:hypothetical protein